MSRTKLLVSVIVVAVISGAVGGVLIAAQGWDSARWILIGAAVLGIGLLVWARVKYADRERDQ